MGCIKKNEAPIVTMPQQVDEPNSTPLDAQKTLNTTPLIRDAISKFMPGYETSKAADWVAFSCSN
jgi:hypothetical protein